MGHRAAAEQRAHVVDVMLSRLPVRNLLAAAVALMSGFVGALFVLDLAVEAAPGEPLVQIGAVYLTWVVLALVTYLVIRRLLPALHDPAHWSDASTPPDPPDATTSPDETGRT